MYARLGEEDFVLRDTDLKPRIWMRENDREGGGGGGGREGLWEGEKRRNIKYARTDAWSHSSLPFLPVSLFPILVPSKRFLLSPFSSSYNRLPLVALFIQLPLPSVLSPSYRVFLAPTSLAKPSRSAVFFLFLA